jgi:uncharacterized surface protein with fasciclin (FAS1) repeats
MKTAVVICVLALASITFGQFTRPTNTIVQNALLLPELSTLVSIVASPGYEAVLNALNDPRNNLTLFAPNNAAFAKLPAVPEYETLIAVLYYHVLGVRVPSSALASLQFPSTLMGNASLVNLGPGKTQVLEVIASVRGVDVVFGIPGSVNFTARVTTADVQCSNGVIHIIDTVLIPPTTASSTALTAGLTELAAALTKAGLVSTVDSLTGITVFAPTNEAFARVNWRALPVADLTNVLLYHVVPAVAYSTDLSNGLSVKTLQGASVTIGVTGAGVTVNGANVALPNVLIKNGVVHVIDSVLLPSRV